MELFSERFLTAPTRDCSDAAASEPAELPLPAQSGRRSAGCRTLYGEAYNPCSAPAKRSFLP